MIDEVRKALAEADETYRSTLDLVLRSYVDDAHLDRAVELVRRLVLSIPTSLDLLVDLARLPGASPALASIASEALAYVLEPEDLLPESRYGLYGYLDDAYLVHALVALAWEALDREGRDSLGRQAAGLEATRLEKLAKLARLGGKLLPPDVRAGLDSKIERARKAVAARSALGPALPASPGADASGVLDRFAQDLARRLSKPPSLAQTGRFRSLAGDTGAYAVSHDQAHFLEHGTRLVALPGLTSDHRFEAAQREPGPIHLVVRFRVHPGKEEAFQTAFDPVARASQQEKGCLAYAVVAREPGPTFVLEERWQDGPALLAHSRTAHFASLGPAMAGILSEPPIIETYRETPDGAASA